MKHYFLILLMTLSYMNVMGQNEEEAKTFSLTVDVEGAKSDEGKMFIAVYNSSETWLKENILGHISEISDGKCTHTFEDLEPGIYAVSIFHDKNSNDKLDTGFLGIPKEPYASSMGAKGMFGPPKWKDAKFEITEEAKRITVKL